jgi:hypothetical protein
VIKKFLKGLTIFFRALKRAYPTNNNNDDEFTK